MRCENPPVGIAGLNRRANAATARRPAPCLRPPPDSRLDTGLIAAGLAVLECR